MQLGMEQDFTAIGRSIQMALVPVFLLSGVAGFLAVLNSRLLRVVDRTRDLEARAEPTEEEQREIPTLVRRRLAINRAITLCTLCALFICIVIVLMFLGIIVSVGVTFAVVSLFVASMGALIGALLFFLREVNLAVRHFRGTELRSVARRR